MGKELKYDMFNVPLDKIDINYFLQSVFKLFGCGVPGLDIEITSGLIVLPRHITRLKINVGLAFNAPTPRYGLTVRRRQVTGFRRVKLLVLVYLDESHIGVNWFLFPVALGRLV